MYGRDHLEWQEVQAGVAAVLALLDREHPDVKGRVLIELTTDIRQAQATSYDLAVAAQMRPAAAQMAAVPQLNPGRWSPVPPGLGRWSPSLGWLFYP